MRKIIAALSASALLIGGWLVVSTVMASTSPPMLETGLARTPPMGFNNYNMTDCSAEFNEATVKRIADLLVTTGLKDAGYEFVNIDDCWAEPQRDSGGNLVPHRTRFPNGIKAVADHVHSKGLKFGIYANAGTMTCSRDGGFPGSLDHEDRDAQLFASWGVDYLKYDNCNHQGRPAVERFTAMRDALARTGRPIIYSICEWAQNEPWMWAPNVGNLWLSTNNFKDEWTSLKQNIQLNLPLSRYARPGAWNDPNMLEVGNGGMAGTEYRTHFSMWAIMAAPLLIGTDLQKASPATFEILLNRDVIAVDQDPLGVQGTVVRSDAGRYVIAKPLAGGEVAVALYNETDQPAVIGVDAREAGLAEASGYRVRDLWTHTDGYTTGTIHAQVPAHGTEMYRLSADPPR